MFQKKSFGRKHGFEDLEQGNLFEKIMNIVDIKRPPILLLKNVKNLKSHDKGNTWKRINEEITSRDYIIFSKIINAKYWVPQSRERIFIVCFDKNVFNHNDINLFRFPEENRLHKHTLNEILEKNPDPKYMLSDKLWNYLKEYAAKHKKKGNYFGYGLNNPKDISRTMSARYYKDTTRNSY